jgi:hypothetical protein
MLLSSDSFTGAVAKAYLRSGPRLRNRTQVVPPVMLTGRLADKDHQNVLLEDALRPQTAAVLTIAVRGRHRSSPPVRTTFGVTI